MQVVNLTASTPLLTGKQGNFSYRVVNQGLTEASGTWTDKIYLSTDTTLETNKDILLDSYQFTGNIASGLFYERNLPFFIPKTAGQYYLIAQTDTTNTVNEGIGIGEENNTTITPITITPAYHATVSTDTEVGVTGNKIILQGKAFSNIDNSVVPYEFVTIAIKNNGFVRELTAFTDGNGNFVKEFQPLPGEAGTYQINAYFPGYSSEDSNAEDSFKLLGMRFNTSGVSYQINADSPFNAQIDLQNLTDIPLSGINYTVDGAPSDWNIQVNVPDTLAGNGTNNISYTITAPNNSAITQDTFNLNLTSAEGVSTTLPITVNLRRSVPNLVANTTLLNNGILRGEQTPVEFAFTNEGGVATGEIQVILPDAPWLKLASPVTLPSLNPGDSSKVTLLLTPDANLPLTVYNGNLVLDVVGNDGDLSLPFSFRAISDAVGSLQISVVDELTFFTESAPKLQDATVILRDYVTGNEVRRITTNTTGIVSWDNLNESYYQLEIQAKNHDSYSQTIQIKAGEIESIESFLSRQTVKYLWLVKPTEIEDKYDINIQSVFETDVPIPTVTIDPPLIDLANLQVIGQVMEIDMTITNHGLIAANNVGLNFGEHPFYKIEPLIDNIGTLDAKSSITVPVKITRTGDFEQVNSDNNQILLLAADQSPEPCEVKTYLQGCITWDFPCGDRKIEKTICITFTNVEGDCPTGSLPSGVFIPPSDDMPLSTIPLTTIHSYTPIEVQPISLECCEIVLYKKDVSGYLEPLVTKAETAINAYLMAEAPNLVKVDLKVEKAEGSVKTCCDSSSGIGLEFSADAKVGASLILGPGINKDFSASEEIPEGTLSFSGSGFFGYQGTISPSISGKVSSGCNLSNPEASLEGELIFELKGGITGEVEATLETKIGNILTTDAVLEGGLFGKATYTWQFYPNQPPNFCINSEGIYLRAFAQANFGNGLTYTFNLFDDPTTKEEEPGLYLVQPAYTGYCSEPSATQLALFSQEDFLSILQSESTKLIKELDSDISIDTNSYFSLNIQPKSQSSSVCAKVTLQLDQRAIMTRSAFLGTLEIDNGNDTTNLENITVNLNIKDSQGNTVNDLFGITNPILSNLTAVDGTGTLFANTSGSAEWTFIPTGNAAPYEPTIYSIGGSLSYLENGNTITVPLLSTPVTVFPQAELYLDYFQQRNVFADDPFTTEIEPSIPFSLGMLIGTLEKFKPKQSLNSLYKQ